MALLDLLHAWVGHVLSDDADILEGSVSVEAARDDLVVHGARQQLHLELGYRGLCAWSDGHGVAAPHVDHELVRIAPLVVHAGRLGQLRLHVGQQNPPMSCGCEMHEKLAVAESMLWTSAGFPAWQFTAFAPLWTGVHSPSAKLVLPMPCGEHGQEVLEVLLAAPRLQLDSGVPVPLRVHEGPGELPQRVPELAADHEDVQHPTGKLRGSLDQLERQDLLGGWVHLPERGCEVQAQGEGEERADPHARGPGPRLQYLNDVTLGPRRG
eukprot:CAMPEP_0168371858 /NCGR_PEP_ID=MMETSP0228-20121227/7985_1 /TAXON_ID=133427 /ORGANISM="Protoceratium reticulatum, Strain CCCM 535 (=CCMP 1889)" /LENGTH=266 /DNA_ID=CAMNT_0008384753 /DNA_START=108 /DNA_END=908 /DNA_ORIENTATION=+